MKTQLYFFIFLLAVFESGARADSLNSAPALAPALARAQRSPASSNTQANAVEFDPTGIEAAVGFSGVTAIHIQAEQGSLFSRKFDFTQKIKDSLREMNELPARSSGGSP